MGSSSEIDQEAPKMVSDYLRELCRSEHSVTIALADEPNTSPEDIASKFYKEQSKVGGLKDSLTQKLKNVKRSKDEAMMDTMNRAASCGKFGSNRPCDLFLKIFAEVLSTLEDDPMNGLVSPSLIASSGTIPLSVISVIPDIMDHMASVIVKAEHEVFLATNYWQTSKSSKKICDSFRELSRKAGENGKKIVVKLMYDRGTPKQALENHQIVPEADWTDEAIQLPPASEIPNVNLQVMNYHRPLVGTFHSKFAIVDRKVAILQSNNIQDRCNVEMCIHLEGEIVQSFYDMALLSWSKPLTPQLPLLNTPPKNFKPLFRDENPFTRNQNIFSGAKQAKRAMSDVDNSMSAGQEKPLNPADREENDGGGSREEAASEYAGRMEKIAEHLNAGDQDTEATEQWTIETKEFHPIVLHQSHEPRPMVMVNRKPHGRPGHGDLETPQNMAWLGGFRFAKRNMFIQTPTFNATPVVEETIKACNRGIEITLFLDIGFNDLGEMIPGQGGTNEDVVVKMYKELKKEKKGSENNLKVFWYTGKDQNKPLNAAEKKRNCHIKFMSIDDEVAIIGNGNQDTQSWFHSQEINIMVDSPQLIAEWHLALMTNQNTHLYGKVEDDGIWRDKEGKFLSGVSKAKGGPLQGIKGLAGAIARVRGTGGF